MRLFDITRLTKRADSSGPTGVDRVDLAYLNWLKGKGKVDYLLNWVGGFSVIDERLGNAFADKLGHLWQGGNDGFSPAQLRPFRRRANRMRAARNWWSRKMTLSELCQVDCLATACRHHLEDLDAMDTSATYRNYKSDPAWKHMHGKGVFFGISHSMLGRTAYMKALAKQKELKRVFFIHDTIPCDFPEYCRRNEGLKHLLRIRNAYRYGTHLIVNSNYTRDRLEVWRKMMNLPEVPVEVIPIGVELPAIDQRNLKSVDATKKPYFVVLGTLEPRKNHMLLMQLWRHFVETMPVDQVPELKIIGRSGWENEAVTRMLERCEVLRGHVVHMDRVMDHELWPLLAGARAMLFPSFVEGWGMPMVEALSMNVPVIASDIPAFGEAGQGVPELLSPLDGNAWAAAIIDYARPTSSRRGEQMARIAQFKPPLWDEHFKRVEAFIGADVLNGSA